MCQRLLKKIYNKVNAIDYADDTTLHKEFFYPLNTLNLINE